MKWLHMTGEVDKSVSCLCQIFSGFNVPKIVTKSYSKNKKVDVF